MLCTSDNGRKINVWSTNKQSNELHTAISVEFSVPSSVPNLQCRETNKDFSYVCILCTEEGTLIATETAVCNSFDWCSKR